MSTETTDREDVKGQMTDDTLYKTLNSGGASPYQGFEWPLPAKNDDGWEPGEWVGPVEGELEECGNGLHCCRLDQILDWLSEELYVLEPADGTDLLEGDDKLVVREARLTRRVETWNETTARLFAADCAEMVLPIFEDKHPDDDRPRKAIEAARQYALGEIGDEELYAAESAAWSAAESAAWSAAESAACFAARDAVRDPAWAAAGAAARHAARAAAKDAAGAALTERLRLYLDCGQEARYEPVPDIREVIDD